MIVSRLFQGSFKDVLGRFKSVSRKFQWCFEEVSSYMDVS